MAADLARRVEQLAGDRPLPRASLPRSPEPTLATLTHEPFSDESWVFEPKLDGVRCLAIVENGEPRLLSRSGQKLDGTYPELVEALREQRIDGSVVLDGEVVAFENGRSSFRRLQGRMQLTDPDAARRTGIPVRYYLFDVLHAAGYDTRALPLRTRKRLLSRLLAFGDPLRYTQHRNTKGKELFADACRRGWEGLIAKRADSRYASKRSSDWLKFRCDRQQEFVICGYTPPRGSRIGFGALLLGYLENGSLHYAGMVGTGFDNRTLRDLHARLRRLEDGARAIRPGNAPRDVHWVEPRLVAQVAFTEWTGDNRLRHPRFLGLRTDKAAEEVVREEGGS
ncbi:MAG: non-homologous end-joining DNA ligase [Streptosporangiales bacterium]